MTPGADYVIESISNMELGPRPSQVRLQVHCVPCMLLCVGWLLSVRVPDHEATPAR